MAKEVTAITGIVRGRRLLLKFPGNFQTVHSRQLNVHHDQIRPLFLNHLEGRRRAGRLAHLIALRAQQETRQTPIHRIVFNQQNFLFIHKDFFPRRRKDAKFSPQRHGVPRGRIMSSFKNLFTLRSLRLRGENILNIPYTLRLRAFAGDTVILKSSCGSVK